MPEFSLGELPIRFVGDSGEVVCPNFRRAADVVRADLSVMRVDEEE